MSYAHTFGDLCERVQVGRHAGERHAQADVESAGARAGRRAGHRVRPRTAGVLAERGAHQPAKAHIQQAIARRAAEDASAAGRAVLAGSLAARGTDLLDLESDGTAVSVCRRLGYTDLDALYQALTGGAVRLDTLLTQLIASG